DTVANRTTFITRVLSSDFTSVTPSVANCDFDTEYLPQTIKGVGFRYKPYNFKEDVYRYSDDLKAYTTLFTGENNNTDAYEGQKLRVFSFMVYNNNNNYVIVPSEGYGEVSRYIPPTQEN
ncbi:MAG: hypothetical protein IIU39_07830, partial [Ruminococcus sp.]|nr:hypothetical protein [Ruminococcus sp.]